MKATDILKKQHKEVKDLFKKIESAKNDNAKNEIFEEIAANVVAHDAIERELFYPACEEGMGMNDLLGEALVEHGVVEFSLYQADQAQGEEDFEFKCTVLKELLEHHIEEEESEFFPKVEKALGKERLEELGVQMLARFEEALAEDFRGPLHENLEQVLAGATKTAPSQRRTAKKKAPAKKTARKTG
ncbi:MAG TPA: hemerythrin domain-containing protein [Polyangiaceae bacterium]|nr:hemerythrin domain-containing protein [Polyangiaceae bacterium]